MWCGVFVVAVYVLFCFRVRLFMRLLRLRVCGVVCLRVTRARVWERVRVCERLMCVCAGTRVCLRACVVGGGGLSFG